MDPHSPDDTPLPSQDAAGWFAAAVQPHDAGLRAWLRAKFPALGDVDDVVQETYARVLQLRARDPLREHAVKPLLFTTARNLALDQLRRRQIVPMDALPDDDELMFADDAPGVGEAVSRQQELALLAEAIQSLPERCRQILTLRKIYGLPQREIARQLGISEHTVEAQVGVGVRRCADYLARFGLP
jgi:RNA polymerase sigma-70 factor (ECF subfamily)